MLYIIFQPFVIWKINTVLSCYYTIFIWNKKINSLIGLKGIVKKVGYLIVVALSVLLDEVVGNTGAIRNLVIYFFVANEGISILENWGKIGLPLPPKVLEVLEQIKSDNGGKKNGS